MNASKKDICIRALKTFVQAFLSAFTIDGVFDAAGADSVRRALLSAAIAALAAGISAVWNLLSGAQDALPTQRS